MSDVHGLASRVSLTLLRKPHPKYPLPGLGRHRMHSTSDTVGAIGLPIGGTFVASAPLREHSG